MNLRQKCKKKKQRIEQLERMAAALRVARELGYSQMCIEDIKRSTSPYMVDYAMAEERKRINERRR